MLHNIIVMKTLAVEEDSVGVVTAVNAEEGILTINFSGMTEDNTTNETCENRNKGAEEEVDIDINLVELGVAADQPQEDGENKEATDAKKKKKKKKKEKEKDKEDAVESKPDKKVSKHVREMQEIIAKREEAKKKKIMEDEERQRKEDEASLKEEADEKKKREKKEEKKLKKKQEGKPLTAKEKADAQRQESKRKQFLEKGGALLQTIGETPSKRPVYITKKSKKTNEASTSKQEDNGVSDEADMVNVEESPAVEEENDDEWDAKCWDDADLQLFGVSAFDDEEEPVSVVKSELKCSFGSPQPVTNKGEKHETYINGEESEKTLRSPICCIMGHVDAGKTKLLDCIRRTNVQEGEAGGITQQIGATYISVGNIRERTKELKADAKLNVPGLVVIDTPGHESFKNLRSRGSGLCDIAILVVDIMDGLKPQTIESIKLLRERNIEFIVALNKVDRLYEWKTCREAPIRKAVKQQSQYVQLEFKHRVTQIITQFKEQGLNTELYYKNKDMGETYSIVPTSATSGEGIPDMLLLLIQWAQKTMVEQLTYSSEVQCKVLEVKFIEGHGTTIDVILINGVLHIGDEIVVCGSQGPIHTTIRALSTLDQRGAYIRHKEIKAAQGIKITAQNLDHAMAGTTLYVVGPDDDVEDIKKSLMDDDMSSINKRVEGVYVKASTKGSLEALLAYLNTPAVNIPVSGTGIGTLHKMDVTKASLMLEKKKEFATILAFDVEVTSDAQKLADVLGVKIFIDKVMYSLFAKFKAYVDNLKEVKKKEAAEGSVFPCVLKIMPDCVFRKKDPIILGVLVKEGILKIGTPICISQENVIDIGRVASIEVNGKPLDYAKKGHKVAIQIIASNADEQQKSYGRHFNENDALYSHISRNSIDALKANFRDELSQEEWMLVVQLKRLFKIQ